MDEIIIFICLIILIIIGFSIRYSKREKATIEKNEDSIDYNYMVKNFIGIRVLFIAEIGLIVLLFSIIFHNLKLYLITLWSLFSFIVIIKTFATAEKKITQK